MNTSLKLTLAAFASTGMMAYAQTHSAPAPAAPAAAAPAVAGLTDGQIVELVKTANEAEIDLGKLGKSKAEHKDVKEFSNHMIDAHKKNEKKGKDAAKSAKVKAVESAESKAIKDNAKSKISDLKKLKGKDFDKAFVDAQITMHQTLLDDLNNKFIPAAQATEVKAHLEATKGEVEAHLTQAQKLQTALTQ